MEHWVNLLSTFGPFAFVVFFAAVLEPRARGQMKDQTAGNFAVRSLIYAATWCTIFVMSGFAVWAWVRTNVPGREWTIRGQLTGLQISDQCRSTMKELYTQRTDIRDSSELNWRVISDQSLAGKEIPLYIDRSTKDKDDYWVYSFPVSKELYGRGDEIALTYDRGSRDLTMKAGATVAKLPVKSRSSDAMIFITQPLLASTAPHGLLRELLTLPFHVVHAQTASLSDMSTRLESDDILIRLAARKDLARAGGMSLPYIQGVLSAKDSSYRTRIGVITALNNMTSLQASSLSMAANCGIVRAGSVDDAPLKVQASRYIASHPGLPTLKACSSIRERETEERVRR